MGVNPCTCNSLGVVVGGFVDNTPPTGDTIANPFPSLDSASLVRQDNLKNAGPESFFWESEGRTRMKISPDSKRMRSE